MPEMMAFCGEKRRVARWATSVCLQEDRVRFGTLENCVILEMPRCDGGDHGGCQMGCRFFWKSQWLQSIAPHDVGSNGSRVETRSEIPDSEFRGHPRDASPGDTYRCQATELSRVAARSGRSAFGRIANERDLNGLRLSEMASSVCSSLIARIARSRKSLSGPCRQTPVSELKLIVGESVLVRHRDEIIATLDKTGKNRGLWFDPLMLRYCGQTLTVRKRVNRFISEHTGRMVESSVPSIVLEELHCDGRTRKFCSRGLQHFWRECWLRRV